MKVIFVILFIVSCIQNSFSQDRDNFTRDSLIRISHIGRSSFGFTISPYVVNKAKTQSITGNYHLKTPYEYGFETGPNYLISINNSYSILVGLHGGAAERNFELFIPKDNFNPNLKFDVYENGQLTSEWDFYMSIPIWIEKRWLTKSKSFWSFLSGVNIRYYPKRYYRNGLEIDYADVNGNNVKVLEINDSIGNNLRPWLNYNIGGGYSFLLRNNNYLQCNLQANFSFKKIVNGTYYINVTGKPQSTGTYSANLSYIGLSFSYIFTGSNKRLRKMYEENLKSKN